ncbi:SusD/RagB family nutrient-binding outer membrane lipoprotein [Mucilaginibacter boryungensis]|uniref:SusD/RagB family nutrient-binding outer membrane lipoprotein n=1 Tax=Mucilaginibacter boryungensis TaxID=768480 RepID=A0ABR9XIY4_9SPHI|nr:SusD/RagB family nutrient-binding outer membrane lipoprotein [Mucilaginibacter boryungensis]MBE9667190.1 SusD/RagB family nutrient-binding outer membrane lipoprotein [Mucilaginibacter boryungensis]
MKKTAYIFVLMLILSACTKDLTSLNVDPKNPASVPSFSLFTEAERSMANTLTSSSVNLNIFRLIEQQWTETTYLNETRYQLPSRNQPDNIWSALYTGALANYQQAKTKLVTDVTDAGTQKNETAIIDILQVYTYFYLVTTYGNVPYSQALDINNPFPKYDDAKTIYNDLLARLDKDIAALNPSAGSFGDADLIYKGDSAAWKKFANTLKLKMGLVIADSDNAKAQSTVQSAVAGGVFTSNADNATFKYVSSPPNTNPIWVDLVQSQRHDFVATSEFLSYLKPNTANQDPRLPYFFAQSSNGVYAGAPNGSGNGGLVFSQYSLPSGPLLTPGSIGSLTNPDFPGLLLDYSETEFNLAEAVQRGYITGSVAAHYNSGVTASITYWGGTAAQAATYLLQPDVAYLTASGTPLQKIARQEYVALYNRGWDAWILTRRLDYPVLLKPAKAYTDFPVRFTYPVSEQNVNVTNYTQASSAIGGDDVTTKLFFDKF